MKKINSILLFLHLLTFVFAVQAQNNSAAVKQSETGKKSSYEELLKKLKNGDTGINFRDLRMSYAKTKAYSPMMANVIDRRSMYAAFGQKDYASALKLAENVLSQLYVDMNGHSVAAAAHRALGNPEKADFHDKVYKGLLDSIISGADGKSAKTAFDVIFVPEEYVILNHLGYRRTQQSLIDENNRKYDVLTAVNPKTNETTKFYFNIDVVWAGYGKSVK